MSEVQTHRREYETIYVLKPTASRESSMDIEKRVNEILGRHGAALTKVENWGRRRLAYQVQKHNRGIYIYLKYLGGGVVVSDLERALRLADDVMKFQTVKLADVAASDAAESVEFEHFDGANIPEEEDETFAKQLGLEGRGPRRDDSRDDGRDDSRDDGRDDDGDQAKAKAESSDDESGSDKQEQGDDAKAEPKQEDEE